MRQARSSTRNFKVIVTYQLNSGTDYERGSDIAFPLVFYFGQIYINGRIHWGLDMSG